MTLEEKIEELERLVVLYEAHCLAVMGTQVQELVSSIVRNAISADAVYQQEYNKGIAVGIEQSSTLPRTLLEQAKADLQRMIKEDTNEQTTSVI